MTRILRVSAPFLVFLWLGTPTPPVATQPLQSVDAHAYDTAGYLIPEREPEPERAPPAAEHHDSSAARGALLRSNARTPLATYDYDLTAHLVRVGSSGDIDAAERGASEGPLVWPPQSRVAAKSVDDVLPTPQVGNTKLQNLVNNLYKGTTTDGIPERGPPPAGLDPCGHLTADCSFASALAHAAITLTYAYTGYDGPAPFVASGTTAGDVGVRAATTTGHARVAAGDVSSAERGRVAAKTRSSALESLAPAVRSNVDGTISRATSGKVRFPGHDGKVYNNSDGLLPRGGSYTEWTAAEAGAKRGAHRVIIEGDPASPNAIYYWDHVNPPVHVGP